MLYQTSIPVGSIDEKELFALVNQLAKLAGHPIEIERQFVISTDSTDLSSILDSLVDAIKTGASVPAVRKNGHKKTRVKIHKQKAAGEKKEPTRGPHVRSITVISTKEKISRFELNRKLQEKSIEPGSELHSPKFGKIFVRAGTLGAAHFVENEQGEVV